MVQEFERAAVERGCEIINHRAKPGLNQAGDFFEAIGYVVGEIGYSKIVGDARAHLPASVVQQVRRSLREQVLQRIRRHHRVASALGGGELLGGAALGLGEAAGGLGAAEAAITLPEVLTTAIAPELGGAAGTFGAEAGTFGGAFGAEAAGLGAGGLAAGAGDFGSALTTALTGGIEGPTGALGSAGPIGAESGTLTTALATPAAPTALPGPVASAGPGLP